MNTDDIRIGANGDIFVHRLKDLTDDEKQRLEAQNSRVIPEAKAAKLEREAKRHWDIFYKRNETKFFRDRHWTTREFQELINFDSSQNISFLELGCGVGNMIYPLVEEGFTNFQFYACDFSPRAVEFVKSNKLYDESRIKAFCADLTTGDLFENVTEGSMDIASLIFVLSAIQPASWPHVASVAYRALRPGGVLLFRDYGRYDMAQLRFKPGHKIAENYYMRQDGTRSYYFTEEETAKLFTDAGFEIVMNTYIQRRTVNFKEGIDVPRIFVQGKYKKPNNGNIMGLSGKELLNHSKQCTTKHIQMIAVSYLDKIQGLCGYFIGVIYPKMELLIFANLLGRKKGSHCYRIYYGIYNVMRVILGLVKIMSFYEGKNVHRNRHSKRFWTRVPRSVRV